MEALQTQIIKFIKEHHVLTLATCVGEKVWCCNCFYAFLEKETIFVFTSDPKTQHITEIKLNNKVAASIVLETKIVGKIRGLQISGTVELAEDQLLHASKFAYLKRFPYAILMDTTFWVLKPNFIKMTDNRLGFGKKLFWGQK